MAFLNAVKAVQAIAPKGDSTSDADFRTGVNIVRRALEEPARIIALNAGVEPSVVVQTILSKPQGFGYNAATDEYVDMVKAGIVDPAKVTRSALQNAASIGGMLLTTEVVVTELSLIHI